MNKDFSDIPDDWILPPGDVQRGRNYFKKHCAMCHSIYPDGRMGTGIRSVGMGPTLFEICNRTAGATQTGKIGKAGQISKKDDLSMTIWFDGALMNYMKNPRESQQGFAPEMNFRGIPEMQPRIDIVHYLHTLTWDNPEVGDRAMKAGRSVREEGGFNTFWGRLAFQIKKKMSGEGK